MQRSVDLVVTDYEMPEMNGVRFPNRCRILGFSGPIVMVTGPIDIEHNYSYCVDYVVRKEESPTALLSLVHHYLAGSQATYQETLSPPGRRKLTP